MNRRYDLLVFDWDGTLADSAAQIIAGMQAAIARLRLPARTDEQIRELIGLGFSDAMTRLFPEFAPEDVDKVLDEYRQWIVAGGTPGIGPAEAPLFEGALDALRDLHAEGYRIAVATGKSRASLKRSLVRHPEVHILLSSSRCADETAPKPDPLMLRELLEEEGIPAERALMVGDTEYDIAMARACAVQVVAVSCGVHECDRLRAAGALALIEEVRHLPGWLRAQGTANAA